MHKTDAGEKRKALKKKALELERDAKALAKARLMEPARRIRQEEADRLKAEAEALKDTARLEDLQVMADGEGKDHKEGL